MKLHVFNDPHGFIHNLAVNRITQAEEGEGHVFINLTDRTLYKNDRVKYLKPNLSSYRNAVNELPDINRIIFYPLDYTAAWFLKEFNKRFSAVPVTWVFWSYEFYHRPDTYLSNLKPFSLRYHRNQMGLIKTGTALLKGMIKRILGRPVFDKQLMNSSYGQVGNFYSFLPRDFKCVFQGIPGNKLTGHQLSFLSIEDITQKVDRQRSAISQEIMIGHSAALSGNHFEMLQAIAELEIKNALFIPIEYGDLQYARAIKEEAKVMFLDDRLQFQESRLDIVEYHKRLSHIGYAVFNFRWQEGLGNILFLIWNGAKVFMQKESSVYIQFVLWGITLFSIEDELSNENLSTLLSPDEADKNRSILEELFTETRVQGYWKNLILTNS